MDPSVDIIPEELLLKIFSYLPVSTLSVVGNVSKKWRRVSKDGTLYRALYFDEATSTDRVLEILQSYRSSILKVVLVDRTLDCEVIIRDGVYPLTKLKYIKIKDCCILDFAIDELLDILSRMEGIEICSNEIRRHLDSIIGSFPKRGLRKLSIKNNCFFDEFTQPCSSFDTRRNFSSLIRSNSDTLESLKLMIWDESILAPTTEFCSALMKCRGLCKFTLKYYSASVFTDRTFELFKQFDNLTTVVLGHVNGVSERAMVSFFQTPQSGNFVRINLYCCGDSVTSQVIEAIGTNCRKLSRIAIKQNYVAGDKQVSARSIRHLFDNCKYLENVSLSNVDINAILLLPVIPRVLPRLAKFEYVHSRLPEFWHADRDKKENTSRPCRYRCVVSGWCGYNINLLKESFPDFNVMTNLSHTCIRIYKKSSFP